jgi:hypothetical protein
MRTQLFLKATAFLKCLKFCQKMFKNLIKNFWQNYKRYVAHNTRAVKCIKASSKLKSRTITEGFERLKSSKCSTISRDGSESAKSWIKVRKFKKVITKRCRNCSHRSTIRHIRFDMWANNNINFCIGVDNSYANNNIKTSL